MGGQFGDLVFVFLPPPEPIPRRWSWSFVYGDRATEYEPGREVDYDRDVDEDGQPITRGTTIESLINRATEAQEDEWYE